MQAGKFALIKAPGELNHSLINAVDYHSCLSREVEVFVSSN